jgi:outer membrane protein OmpA-like peptidoglycan-associated protein
MAVVLAAGTAAPAFAQDPPDTIPAGARREIRDLRYVVQDLAVRIDDLRVKETDLEIRLELAADVLFDFDRSDLKPDAERVLARAAAFIRERAVGTVRIEGHTDAKGTEAYNQRLSERRAAAVKTWLTTTGGLSSTSFSTKGRGATKPVAPNAKPDGSDDPDGRQKNRRVEIIIAKKG